VHFHQEIQRGADAVTALHTAQLAEIAAGAQDWTWAAFEVLGGTFPQAALSPESQPLLDTFFNAPIRDPCDRCRKRHGTPHP
jgi:hypothetical protein